MVPVAGEIRDPAESAWSSPSAADRFASRQCVWRIQFSDRCVEPPGQVRRDLLVGIPAAVRVPSRLHPQKSEAIRMSSRRPPPSRDSRPTCWRTSSPRSSPAMRSPPIASTAPSRASRWAAARASISACTTSTPSRGSAASRRRPTRSRPPSSSPIPRRRSQLKLLWLACGNQDGLIRISQGVHAYLKEHDVPHIWHVDSHGHDPTEWGKTLSLAQRLSNSDDPG